MQNAAEFEDIKISESINGSAESVDQVDIEDAVEVVDLEYRYPRNAFLLSDLLSRRQNPAPVLDKISLRAPRGQIYALLGSSGCGKTTFLKCVLGRIKPNAGQIRLFGQTPGSQQCPVPGPGVGYMPQELALYPDFTITETLHYFGQLYHMAAEELQTRSAHIVALLNLPTTKDQLVRQLSGGQQRRVSLACALLHSPPLLVLDEPTVGVDPILRAAIWTHLEELCCQSQTTVIITTHYIEEARAAGTIGLMRSGRLLAQEPPEVLLAEHCLTRLEDVFLRLCLQQDNKQEEKDSFAEEDGRRKRSSQKETNVNEREQKNEAPKDKNNNNISSPQKAFSKGNSSKTLPLNSSALSFDLHRFTALLAKNFIRRRRSLSVTTFYVLFFALQFALFMLTAGRTPTHLPVAVVNEEKESPANLSAHFFTHLPADAFHLLNFSGDLQGAEQMVVEGRAWAVLHFGEEFSAAMDDRRVEHFAAENETIEASNLHLYLDMSNLFVNLALFQNIIPALRQMVADFLRASGDNPALLSTPLDITEVIYGRLDFGSFVRDAFTPGFILFPAYFTTAAVTALALLNEREDGLLERSLVAGVRPLEVFFSQVITQAAVLVAQQAVLFTTVFLLFGVVSQGPIGLIFLLCYLQGVAGIMFGLVAATLGKEVIPVSIVTLGSFLPCIILSGFFWPVSAVVWWLRPVSLAMPQTMAMEAMKAILTRGWSADAWEVQLGFASTSAWVVGYLLLGLYLFVRCFS